MTHDRPQTAHYLLLVRLNNFDLIRSAYGAEAAQAALIHVRRCMGRYLPGVDLRRTEREEIELLVRDYPLENFPIRAQMDRLCLASGAEPLRFGGSEIFLSVSAGYSMPGKAETRAAIDALRQEARMRLAASPLAQETIAQPDLYRRDMAVAAALLESLRRSPAHFALRPVANPRDPDTILHHEIMLRAEGVDCGEACAALDRIGLAHCLDRKLLSDAVDRLEADPVARLSVPISARSFSLHLHGRDVGWSGLLDRLKRNRDMARRLVIEMVENERIPSIDEAQAFTRALQTMGVRICVGGFGSGHASIRELLALSPDMVKLDSGFMHASHQSAAHRARVRHLMGLARTISPMVIVDGVQSAWHLHLALEDGVEWIAGSCAGQPGPLHGEHRDAASSPLASLNPKGGSRFAA